MSGAIKLQHEGAKLTSFCDNTDAFDPNQYYLVLCLPYGGTDLETFKLKSWAHAASILWQVAYGLATAERSWHFEVRCLSLYLHILRLTTRCSTEICIGATSSSKNVRSRLGNCHGIPPSFVRQCGNQRTTVYQPGQLVWSQKQQESRFASSTILCRAVTIVQVQDCTVDWRRKSSLKAKVIVSAHSFDGC